MGTNIIKQLKRIVSRGDVLIPIEPIADEFDVFYPISELKSATKFVRFVNSGQVYVALNDAWDPGDDMTVIDIFAVSDEGQYGFLTCYKHLTCYNHLKKM